MTDTLLQVLGGAAGVLAVLGVFLNNHKLRSCFILFMISNAICGVVHTSTGLWTLVARDVAFFVLGIDGWYRWGRLCEKES